MCKNKAVHVRALAQLDMRPSRLAPSHQPNHSSPTASTQIASRQLLTSANEAKKRLVIAVVDVFNGTRCEGSVGSIGYFEAVDQIVLHELRPHTPCQGKRGAALAEQLFYRLGRVRWTTHARALHGVAGHQPQDAVREVHISSYISIFV